MESKILAVAVRVIAMAPIVLAQQPTPQPPAGGVPGGVAGGVPGGVSGLQGQLHPGRETDDRLYERGQRALDNRRWDQALESFNEVAARAGSRADGALYWKAYSQSKLGRSAEALAAIEQLRKSNPKSRWLDDAKALEMEVRQAQGQPVKPESESDDDLKLVALSGLVHSDPERAMPILEKLLQSGQSPKVKERALFVLMQSGSPKARETVVKMANGGANPDLQAKAVQMLGMMGAKKELAQVYAATADAQVKRSALQGFMMSGAKDEVFQAAKSEKNPALRGEAIRMLGMLGAQNEIWQLYQSETDAGIRRELVHSMLIGGNTEKVLEIARQEKDSGIRREAIRTLGMMDSKRTAEALASLYASESEKSIRREIVQALFIQGNAKLLVDFARKETDPALKREIVHSLGMMKSKEAADYLAELLK
ncbi:MAG: HEAT repeat domain-containing protein [Candidatus Solibacter usitatus]|nr:HEAT repeat domain-containing protein [Candidatus Solibacter usitatus]